MAGNFKRFYGDKVLAAALCLTAIFGAACTASASKEHGTLKVGFSHSHPDTLVLQWTGKVASPMADDIRNAFETRKNRAKRVVLVLDSGGGSVKEGERTIEVLRRIRTTHRLKTVVNHGRTCGSMCVFIYMQGQKRVAALTSSWLFHEASRSDGKRTVSLDRALWEGLMDKYFVPEGVSPQWIAAMKPLTHRTDLWQTGADLVNGGSGIVHEALGNQKGRVVHDGRPAGPASERIATRNAPPASPQPDPETAEPTPGEAPSPPETDEAPAPDAKAKLCTLSVPNIGAIALPCGAMSLN